MLNDKLVSLTEMIKNTVGDCFKTISDLPIKLSEAVSIVGKTFEEVGAKLL